MDSPDGLDPAVRAALDASGVAYEVLPCDPDFADTAAFCERYGFSPEDSANTIVVASKKEPKKFAACVVTATTRLDVNGTVRKLLGVNKASFADAEETKQLTGQMIGGVTALALPPDLRLYVDSRVMQRDEIILGGGSRSAKVKVAPAVLLKLPNVEVIEGLAMEPRT